ncbi:MAG: tetratricopeptide repeat protein [Deltaproteobacteria bacterium]|nr:MAG: tetratricopeptide repeat protein [Deltaproteobacteria bacterium]
MSPRTVIAAALLLCPLPLATACKSTPEPTPEERAAKRKRLLDEARARIRNEKEKDAEALLLSILEEEPEHPEAVALMARVRMKEGDYASAVALFERAIKAGNDAAETYFYLGEAHRLQGAHDKAAEAYRKAFERAPENADYGLALGIALEKTKQWAEAEKVLEKVADLDPGARFVWTELGNAVREQGRLDDALRLYLKAQNTYGDDKMAHAGAALVYEAKGDVKRALDEWSQYIRKDCCSDYSNNVAKKKIMELGGGGTKADGEAQPAEGDGEAQAAAAE